MNQPWKLQKLDPLKIPAIQHVYSPSPIFLASNGKDMECDHCSLQCYPEVYSCSYSCHQILVPESSCYPYQELAQMLSHWKGAGHRLCLAYVHLRFHMSQNTGLYECEGERGGWEGRSENVCVCVYVCVYVWSECIVCVCLHVYLHQLPYILWIMCSRFTAVKSVLVHQSMGESSWYASGVGTTTKGLRE